MSNLFSSMSTINLAAPDSSGNKNCSTGSGLSWSYVDPCTTTTTLFSNKPFPIPAAPVCPPSTTTTATTTDMVVRSVDCITPEDNIISSKANSATCSSDIAKKKMMRKSPPPGTSCDDDFFDGEEEDEATTTTATDSTSDGMTPTPSGKEGGAGSTTSLSSQCGIGPAGLGFGSGSTDSLGDLLDCIDQANLLLPLGFDIENLNSDEEYVDAALVTTSSPNKSSSTTTTSSTNGGDDGSAPAGIPVDYHSSTLPDCASICEAADYVNAPRNDIDMEVQNALRTYEKAEALQSLVAKWQKQSQLTDEQRHISLKILVHEAANRSLSALKNLNLPSSASDDDVIHSEDESGSSSSSSSSEDAKLTTYAAWKNIEDRASTDCRMFGYQTPQRNLSCMCIFNPDLLVAAVGGGSSSSPSPASCSSTSSSRNHCSTPLPCPYGENDDDRHKRSQVQAQTLRALHLQQAAYANDEVDAEEKKPSLFLETPLTTGKTSVSSSTTSCTLNTPRPTFMRTKSQHQTTVVGVDARGESTGAATPAVGPVSRFASTFQHNGQGQ